MGVKLGQKWAVKDGNLLASNQVGSRFFNKEFDFSRASNGTYVDRDGLLKTAELYNKFNYSEDFSGWGNLGGSTLTPNAAISPDGNLNATKITEGTNVLIYKSIAAGTYTQSYYAKKGTSDLFGVYTGGIGNATFDLTNGVVLSNNLTSASIQDVGNGWYRCIATSTSGSSTFYGINYNGVDGSTIYVYGAQLVEGTEPLAYQYTNGLQGLPRISFEDGVGHLLLEPQTTQLVPYSEDFTQWVTGGNTAIEGGYLAPDGTNSAYKVSGSNNALIATGLPNLFTSSTRSIYARTVSGTGQANLMTYYGNTNNLFTITDQWQRFDVNSAISTGSTGFYAVDFRGDTNISEIIIWGANATNDQTYPTSYIKTEGTSVTRLADVCNNSGSAQDFNSEEGVLYAEISALADTPDYREFGLSDGTTSNRVLISHTTTSNGIRGQVLVGGSSALNFTPTISDVTDFHKVAIKFKQNDYAMWVNGSEVATSSSALVFPKNTLNELAFDSGAGSDDFYGKVRNLQVFTEALSDAELQKLTT